MFSGRLYVRWSRDAATWQQKEAQKELKRWLCEIRTMVGSIGLVCVTIGVVQVSITGGQKRNSSE